MNSLDAISYQLDMQINMLYEFEPIINVIINRCAAQSALFRVDVELSSITHTLSYTFCSMGKLGRRSEQCLIVEAANQIG